MREMSILATLNVTKFSRASHIFLTRNQNNSLKEVVPCPLKEIWEKVKSQWPQAKPMIKVLEMLMS